METRRGSMRSERKPAVLQRHAAAASPAGPSAAFQSRTTNQADGPWARRRGSSFSQGSLPPGRRISVSKGSDLAPPSERQSSVASGPETRASSEGLQPEPHHPSFAQQTPWDAQLPPQPEAVTEGEDPVKVQERVMREKRELAKKRRQEEEKRMEAEKQERLKARLAALEGAGKSRKEREAEAAAATVIERGAEKQVTIPSEKVSTLGDKAFDTPRLESVAKAQALEAATETPEAEKREVAGDDSAARQTSRAPFAAGATLTQQQSPQNAQIQSSSSFSSPGDRNPQSFEKSPLANSGAFSPWGPPQLNGNVWGSSGIGNGTFEKASSFAPRPLQGSNLPLPPGMVRPGANRASPQVQGQDNRTVGLSQTQVADPLRSLPPPGIDSIPESNWSQARNSNMAAATAIGRGLHGPGPIAPPSRAQQLQSSMTKHSEGISAWNQATQTLPYEGQSKGPRKETTFGSASGTVRATFKRTVPSEVLGGPRRVEKTEYSVSDIQGTRSTALDGPQPPNAQTQPSGPFVTSVTDDLRAMGAENLVRIPDASGLPHARIQAQQPPIAPPVQTRAMSASPGNIHYPVGPLAPALPHVNQRPPPPESTSLNSGIGRPTVRLPPPPPVVKLPPSFGQSRAVSASAAAHAYQPTQLPGTGRPLVHNEDWQARFNGLFGRAPIQTEVPPSPPGTPPKAADATLAVASSSKTFLNYTSAATTVSLPRISSLTSIQGLSLDDGAETYSKPMMEAEEPSFGSQPKVRMPHGVTYRPEFYEEAKSNMLKMNVNSKVVKEVESRTRMSAEDVKPLLFYKAPGCYYLRIPGTRLSNKPVHYETSVAERRPNHQSFNNRKPSGKAVRPKNKEAEGESSPKTEHKSPGPKGSGTPRKRSGFMKKTPAETPTVTV